MDNNNNNNNDSNNNNYKPNNANKDVEDNKVIAALAYIIFFLPLIVAPCDPVRQAQGPAG